jgi:hypothetical protein
MSRPFYTLRCTINPPGGPTGYAYPGQMAYVWSPTGELPSDISAYSYGDPELVPTPPTWYNSGSGPVNIYVMAFKLSEDAIVGESYYRTWGTDPVYQINVTAAAPPDNPIILAPGSTQTDIQTAITNGYSPIILAPGDYLIISSLDVAGASVAPVVAIDGQNAASLTAGTALGTNPIIDITRPVDLTRLSCYGSIPDLSQSVLGVTASMSTSTFPFANSWTSSLARAAKPTIPTPRTLTHTRPGWLSTGANS